MVRCFIGIPMPPAYRKNLASLTDMLRSCLASRVSWTRPENWHLTLKFLGEIPEDKVDEVSQALGRMTFSPFRLRAGSGGFFPDVRRPRVIWKGLMKGGVECAALAEAVGTALEPLGFEPETREFRSHLTLGRVKNPAEDDWERCLATMDNGSWPEVLVDRFVLWKSELRPDGPVYTPLAEYPLG